MNRRLSISTLLVLMLALSACGFPAAAPAQPTQDMGALVNEALANTQSAGANTQVAQAGMNATIATSVAATVTAADAMATPVPTEIVVELTEAELAALIDEAVAEANAASAECSTSATSATADGTVDQSEYEEIYIATAYADETVAYALDLIYMYDEYYGELAGEAIELMNAVESELEATDDSLNELVSVLEEINTTLASGVALADETIAEVQQTADAVAAQAAEASAQAQAYISNLSSQIESRTSMALATAPDSIPADRPTTITAGFEYLDYSRTALEDNQISSAELQEIARLGANFNAGAMQFGGAELQNLSQAISGPEGITARLASGQNRQAREGLGTLELSLGQRPSMPQTPGGGGGRPGRP